MFDIVIGILWLILTGVALLDCYRVRGFRLENRYIRLAVYLGWIVCDVVIIVRDILLILD